MFFRYPQHMYGVFLLTWVSDANHTVRVLHVHMMWYVLSYQTNPQWPLMQFVLRSAVTINEVCGKIINPVFLKASLKQTLRMHAQERGDTPLAWVHCLPRWARSRWGRRQIRLVVWFTVKPRNTLFFLVHVKHPYKTGVGFTNTKQRKTCTLLPDVRVCWIFGWAHHAAGILKGA